MFVVIFIMLILLMMFTFLMAMLRFTMVPIFFMTMFVFMVVGIAVPLFVLLIMMVMRRHGDFFDTVVGMDHPHVGIGGGDFFKPGVFERDADGEVYFRR